jgi:hypothetical protein
VSSDRRTRAEQPEAGGTSIGWQRQLLRLLRRERLESERILLAALSLQTLAAFLLVLMAAIAALRAPF